MRVGHSEFSQSEQSRAAGFQKPKADAQEFEVGGRKRHITDSQIVAASSR
jgi:hypothetical protein